MTNRVLLLGCLALAACAWWPRDAHAQVRRCTLPDGKALYTDQKCEALGAVPAKTPAAAPAGARGAVSAQGARGANLYRGGCSRTLQDLVFELSTAIDAGDANRLSSVYHWVGVSDGTAAHVMDRLEAIAHRPLLDITAVDAQPQAQVSTAAEAPRTSVRRPPDRKSVV